MKQQTLTMLTLTALLGFSATAALDGAQEEAKKENSVKSDVEQAPQAKKQEDNKVSNEASAKTSEKQASNSDDKSATNENEKIQVSATKPNKKFVPSEKISEDLSVSFPVDI